MLKFFHVIFAVSSLAGFTGRVALSEFNPALLQAKAFKIAPHVIDTALLLSGIALMFRGDWLSAEYGWIVSKLILLLGYVSCGVLTMRCKGGKRWAAFVAAIACFAFIFAIAVGKRGFI